MTEEFGPEIGKFSPVLVGHVSRILTEIFAEYGTEMLIVLGNPTDPAELLCLSNTTPERTWERLQAMVRNSEIGDFALFLGQPATH